MESFKNEGSEEFLLKRIEQFLEADENLGYDIGSHEDVIDFLAKLEWESIEILLKGFMFESDSDRKKLFESIEEAKGRLSDSELPKAEIERRKQFRIEAKKKGWF